jgi:hypothetical protein
MLFQFSKISKNYFVNANEVVTVFDVVDIVVGIFTGAIVGTTPSNVRK